MTTSDRTRLDSRASNKSVWFFAALKESLETWIRPERIELPSHPGYPHSAETAAIFKIRFKGADSFIVLPQTNISDCGTPRIFPVRIGLDLLQHLYRARPRPYTALPPQLLPGNGLAAHKARPAGYECQRFLGIARQLCALRQ